MCRAGTSVRFCDHELSRPVSFDRSIAEPKTAGIIPATALGLLALLLMGP
jgi:hypothetical protein